MKLKFQSPNRDLESEHSVGATPKHHFLSGPFNVKETIHYLLEIRVCNLSLFVLNEHRLDSTGEGTENNDQCGSMLKRAKSSREAVRPWPQNFKERQYERYVV